MDWLDLLAVQGTLKSFLQHHSLKPSILWCSASFMAQLSHPHMITGKTMALTTQTFVGKVVFLFFNTLSTFVKKAMPKNAQTTTQLHSYTSKVMLKILQARLQQYVNCELPDVQAGFRKGRGSRDQIGNIHWIIEKAREFQKKHLFLLY